MRTTASRLVLIGTASCLLFACDKPSSKNPPSSTNAVERKLSAREAYKLATGAAKQWSPDSKLYSISQRGVLQELEASPNGETTWDFADVKTGESRRWVFEFFSDKSLAVLFVDVLDGKADSNEMSKFDKKPPSIPDNWIDSVDVMKLARGAVEGDLKIGQDKYMALSKLRMMEDGKPAWQIEFYESQGDKPLYAVEVDGVSPKVLFKEKAK